MYSPCTATFHSAEKFNSEGTMKPFQQSPASNETITSNEEDMMRSLEFLKHILESQYVRGDRVCIKNLFLHISKASKAPPKIQICCGKDIKDFKKFLSKFPETFLVKNNYVSLNVYKDGKYESMVFYTLINLLPPPPFELRFSENLSTEDHLI